MEAKNNGIKRLVKILDANYLHNERALEPMWIFKSSKGKKVLKFCLDTLNKKELFDNVMDYFNFLQSKPESPNYEDFNFENVEDNEIYKELFEIYLDKNKTYQKEQDLYVEKLKAFGVSDDVLSLNLNCFNEFEMTKNLRNALLHKFKEYIPEIYIKKNGSLLTTNILNMDYNIKKELINNMTSYYRNNGESMWNFKSKQGENALDFCLELYNNEDVWNDLNKYLNPTNLDTFAQGNLSWLELKFESYNLLDRLKEIGTTQTDLRKIFKLKSDMHSKFGDLVQKIFDTVKKDNVSQKGLNLQDIKTVFKKESNLTEEQFSELFDYIMIQYYHKEKYDKAREYVGGMSEEDKIKFERKFVSSHSPELLKRHFTDFENINQEEFKEAVFKVTGQVQNIPMPPVLFENNLYQFTNQSFVNSGTGDILYLVKDLNENQFFLEFSHQPDSDGDYKTVYLLESEDFNVEDFLSNHKLVEIYDFINLFEVVQEMYNPEQNFTKVKEQLQTRTKEEKTANGGITLETVLQSNLSEAILELQNNNPENVESRLEFCRQLIDKYGDLDMGIKDVDLNNLWTKVWNSKQKIEASLQTQIEGRNDRSSYRSPVYEVLSEEKSTEIIGGKISDIAKMSQENPEFLAKFDINTQNVVREWISKKDQLPEGIKNGAVIDIQQTVNGENKFLVYGNSMMDLDIRYYHNPLLTYEYDKAELLAQSTIPGEVEFKVVGNIQEERIMEIIILNSLKNYTVYEGGQLENIHPEIAYKMVENQIQQGNKIDLSVFDKDLFTNKADGGFEWIESPEGVEFWENVIEFGNQEIFFEKYPLKDDGYTNGRDKGLSK